MSTSYHHGDLRAALLETTRALLVEVGLEGLGVREVARRTGVSHAAVYNHFRDKAALLGALVDEAFVKLAAEMRRARSSDPSESLGRIGVAYVRFAYRHRAEFKIMFRPELCAPDVRTARETNAAYGLLVDAVDDAQRCGAIVPGPAAPLVLAAWAIVHGLASLIVDGPDGDLAPTLAGAEKLARSCLETLGNGMRPRT